MQYFDSHGQPSEAPARGSQVQVDGRDDIGEVVDSGENIGSLYCVAVHFRSTGEVAYYDRDRVRPATR